MIGKLKSIHEVVKFEDPNSIINYTIGKRALRIKSNILGAPALYIVYFAEIIIITYAFPVMSHI